MVPGWADTTNTDTKDAALESILSILAAQNEKLSNLTEQFLHQSTHMNKLDRTYLLNRLDDIDTLLSNLEEIVEELDMSSKLASPTHPKSHQAINNEIESSMIDNEIYDAKIKHYTLNKKIMKQLMPLYCALWIKYQ